MAKDKGKDGDKKKGKSKKKKGKSTYEGVELYTDVTKKEVNNTKKQLLKEMALAGNAGMKQILKDKDRVGYEDAWDRYDRGVPGDTPDSVAAAIDEERDRMLGGLEVARGKSGKRHSKAMDRMAARNINYHEDMKHAASLSKDWLKKEIAAMKLAAAGGGGGGGGGGGSRQSYTPAIDMNSDDPAAYEAGAPGTENRLGDLFQMGGAELAKAGIGDAGLQRAAGVMQYNQPFFHEMDQQFGRALQSGADPNVVQEQIFNAAINRGMTIADASAAAGVLGGAYGADPSRIGRSAAGAFADRMLPWGGQPQAPAAAPAPAPAPAGAPAPGAPAPVLPPNWTLNFGGNRTPSRAQ